MNPNQLIMKLSKSTGYPVAPDIYEGDSDKYIIFVNTDERGELFGDDKELLTTSRFYISFYCPHSYNNLSDRRKIKIELVKLGFQVESVSSYLEKTLDGTDYTRRTLYEVNYTSKED